MRVLRTETAFHTDEQASLWTSRAEFMSDVSAFFDYSESITAGTNVTVPSFSAACLVGSHVARRMNGSRQLSGTTLLTVIQALGDHMLSHPLDVNVQSAGLQGLSTIRTVWFHAVATGDAPTMDVGDAPADADFSPAVAAAVCAWKHHAKDLRLASSEITGMFSFYFGRGRPQDPDTEGR